MGVSANNDANLRSTTFPKTSEAYIYDLVYTELLYDKEFWEKWNIVDCATATPDKSRKWDVAPIRVVMDLPLLAKLPQSYPPSLPGQPGVPRSIPGLPEGYTVPLEGFTIADGKILLDRQKVFHDGQVDPNYRWLEEIIMRADDEAQENEQKAIEDSSGGVGAWLGWSSSSNKQTLNPRPKAKTSSNTGFLAGLTDTIRNVTDAVGLTHDQGEIPTTVDAFSTAETPEEMSGGVVANTLVNYYDGGMMGSMHRFGKGHAERSEGYPQPPKEQSFT